MSWKNCSSVCTDAAAMMGKYSGVAGHIKNMNSEIVYIHCLLHRHPLAVKQMPSDLVEMLDQWFSICGTRTTSGTRDLFRWYAVVDIG